MGEELPDGTVQGYTCGCGAAVGMQGHDCEWTQEQARQKAAAELTDADILDVAMPQFRMVIDALVSAGVQPPRLLRLLSGALVQLDQEHARTARVPQSSSPVHDAALAALAELRACLAQMRVTDAVRLEGYTLLEQNEQWLAHAEHIVHTHSAMARGEVERSRLLLADGRPASELPGIIGTNAQKENPEL